MFTFLSKKLNASSQIFQITVNFLGNCSTNSLATSFVFEILIGSAIFQQWKHIFDRNFVTGIWSFCFVLKRSTKNFIPNWLQIFLIHFFIDKRPSKTSQTMGNFQFWKIDSSSLNLQTFPDLLEFSLTQFTSYKKIVFKAFRCISA